MTKPRKPAAVAGLVRLEDERAGAVAEEHRPVALRGAPARTPRGDTGPSDSPNITAHSASVHGIERRVALGADEEDAAVRARADERVGDLEAREEPGALHPDVEGVRRLEAELARRGGRRCPGSSGPGVIVAKTMRSTSRGLEAGVGEGAPRGLERRGPTTTRPAREAALADAGALADPLVGRVHEAREPLVRDDAVRARTCRSRG